MATRRTTQEIVVDDKAERTLAKARLAARTAAVADRVGATARARRLELKRTQEDVASKVLIARNSLQVIERGAGANPRLSTLVGLAATLGVTVESLLAGAEPDGD